MQEAARTRQEFEAALRARGRRYHIHHPYHRMMAAGELTPQQIRAWVANRFYYQVNIPRKDAALLANCPDRETRRRWVHRILAQDGSDGDAGGIEAWMRLGEACGLQREDLWSMAGVLPGVRFAVDAYVRFVRDAEWHEGVAASLSELFAPEIHRQRLDNWPRDYPWIDPAGLGYFQRRIGEAARDLDHGLALTLEWADSAERQRRVLAALDLKLDVLWSLLDALYLAYVLDMPPYAGIPEGT
ncbi:pyrroloquinoline-quinone synthase PqqC [Ectothiorhodospiraceae bacterium 2226]|nr:pyrroloquinoline-quinone synthase PqqC [Ectothiorhodospiraceae bacterium 2226]